MFIVMVSVFILSVIEMNVDMPRIIMQIFNILVFYTECDYSVCC